MIEKPLLSTIVLIFQTIRALIDKNSSYKKYLNEVGLLNILLKLLSPFFSSSFLSSFSSFKMEDVSSPSPITTLPIQSTPQLEHRLNNSIQSDNHFAPQNPLNHFTKKEEREKGKEKKEKLLKEVEELEKKYEKKERVLLFNVVGDCVAILLNGCSENVRLFKSFKSDLILKKTLFIKELSESSLRVLYEMVMNDKSTDASSQFVQLFHFVLEKQKEEYSLGKQVLNVLRRIFVANENLKNVFCEQSGFLTLFSLIPKLKKSFKKEENEDAFQFLLEVFKTFTVMICDNPTNRKLFDEQITFGLANALRLISLPFSKLDILFEELLDLCCERVSFVKNDIRNKQSIIKNPKIIIVLLDIAFYSPSSQKIYLFFRLLELSNSHRNKESMCSVHALDFLLEKYKSFIVGPLHSSISTNSHSTNTNSTSTNSTNTNSISTSSTNTNSTNTNSTNTNSNSTNSTNTNSTSTNSNNTSSTNTNSTNTNSTNTNSTNTHSTNTNSNNTNSTPTHSTSISFSSTPENSNNETSYSPSDVRSSSLKISLKQPNHSSSSQIDLPKQEDSEDKNQKIEQQYDKEEFQVSNLAMQLLIYLASHKLTVSVLQNLFRLTLDNGKY